MLFQDFGLGCEFPKLCLQFHFLLLYDFATFPEFVLIFLVFQDNGRVAHVRDGGSGRVLRVRCGNRPQSGQYVSGMSAESCRHHRGNLQTESVSTIHALLLKKKRETCGGMKLVYWLFLFSGTLYNCKFCDRYLIPPKAFVKAEPESKQLLSICLKKIKPTMTKVGHGVLEKDSRFYKLSLYDNK